MIENVPSDEAAQIETIVSLTRQQLFYRYPGETRVLRGVHAKDHGCVRAEFAVHADLPAKFHHGVFAFPGRTHSAWVRFSNAATDVAPDSPVADPDGTRAHGSRGMAVKLLGVEGPMLEPLPGEPVHGAPTQDFLLINQPVFAFANVEDYLVLSQALVDNKDKQPESLLAFLKDRLTSADPETRQRGDTTKATIGRIRSLGRVADPPVFQPPPASPVENSYFSASPFLLGPDQVMRFRMVPEATAGGNLGLADPNYLRTALVHRLRDEQAGPVAFHFEVQVRDAASIDPDTDIENASREWAESSHPFERIATLTIPLQEFDFAERHVQCERMVFNPWHGLEDHQPLGGINRLRRAVYAASALLRNLPKEPGASGS